MSDAAFRLTAAELEVARLRARGLPFVQIAVRRGVSDSTVRNQMHRVYEKLGIDARPGRSPIYVEQI